MEKLHEPSRNQTEFMRNTTNLEKISKRPVPGQRYCLFCTLFGRVHGIYCVLEQKTSRPCFGITSFLGWIQKTSLLYFPPISHPLDNLYLFFGHGVCLVGQLSVRFPKQTSKRALQSKYLNIKTCHLCFKDFILPSKSLFLPSRLSVQSSFITKIFFA